mmetsp:Transcript_3945/g.8446  ORF Transcript_3945/g.8446 Transcript_3945/m.8446 type:complete len:228 (-) Transcript_3945:76-759(-)
MMGPAMSCRMKRQPAHVRRDLTSTFRELIQQKVDNIWFASLVVGTCEVEGADLVCSTGGYGGWVDCHKKSHHIEGSPKTTSIMQRHGLSCGLQGRNGFWISLVHGLNHIHGWTEAANGRQWIESSGSPILPSERVNLLAGPRELFHDLKDCVELGLSLGVLSLLPNDRHAEDVTQQFKENLFCRNLPNDLLGSLGQDPSFHLLLAPHGLVAFLMASTTTTGSSSRVQ